MASGDSAHKNGGYGIFTTAPGGGISYRDNNVKSNATEGVSGGVRRGGNDCNGAGVVSAVCA